MQRRVAFFVFTSFFALFAVAAGCGRSTLDGYDLTRDASVKDGGTDARPDGAPTCNPATCPDGCCDENGTCVAGGSSIDACGAGGGACVDCVAQGFDTCDQTTHSCARLVDTCDQATCPNGCCLVTPGGTLCEDGTSRDACGSNAATCTDCGGGGNACDPTTRACVAAKCDSSTCSGCCTASGECHTGTDQAFCGSLGGTCVDCTSGGGSCDASDAGVGGSCVATPPSCNSTTCADGCCVGADTCVHGAMQTDNACGLGGAQCQNCANAAKVCSGNVCTVIPCAQSCATSNGCCAADGTCHAGFLSNACGQGGAACTDCGAQTCDVNTRSCQSTTTCPTAYPSCAGGVTTTAPTTTKACSTDDLNNAATACASGAHTSGCNDFFSFETASNPSCGSCLTQFNYDFVEGRGIAKCVAPVASTACNHNTGCAADCTSSSCSSCGATNESACESQVRTGQCLTYYTQSLCAAQAFTSPSASFCNPLGKTYGAWLQGVGAKYCGN